MRKIILNSLVSLCFCIFLFAGCATIPDSYSDTCTEPEVLAEFKIEGGAKPILLPVTLDGEEYLFCLDTGSTTTIFDASLKDKLGKRFLWPKKGKAAGGKTIEAELFRIPQAYLGPLNMRDCGLIAVIDLELLSPALARKAQGIIGMDFLKKYVVRIDFDTATVSFLKSKRDTGIFSFLQPEKNEHPEWGQPLSIKYEFLSGLPLVKGRIADDIPVNFMIDTGHVIPKVDGNLKSRIFNNISSKVELKTKKDSNKTAVIDNFSIGSFEYRDAIFHESNYSSLGMGFLRRHLVTFDFPNRQMYLKKGRYFDRPTNAHIWFENLGLELRRQGNDIFVDSIDPNGPGYKKGIRQNDIILKVYDQDVTSYSLTEFVTLLLSLPKDIEILTIKIKRDDDIQKFLFPVEKKHNNKADPNGTD